MLRINYQVPLIRKGTISQNYLIWVSVMHTFISSKYPFQHFNASVKKGYSSTALFSKVKPLSVSNILKDAPDAAGRCITAYFPDNICIIGLYVMNSGAKLVRLSERDKFDKALIEHIEEIKRNDPAQNVIICGDLNVGFLENDIYNMKDVKNKLPGATDKERDNFSKLLNLGFSDAYIHKFPDHLDHVTPEESKGAYTWYSTRGFWKRGGDKGWRLDYFLVQTELKDKIQDFEVAQTIAFSDHCPIIMTLVNK